MPEGGRLRVATANVLVDDAYARAHAGLAPGAYVAITVADTGVGIPEDEQGQLFERFFRASTATRDAIPGTGLGLAIVRSIVEAHGGTVAVRSAIGEGTTFVVSLPLAA